MGQSDVTARAKRKARRRARAGAPSPCASVFGVRRRQPSSRGSEGAVGAGQPAQTGGRGEPASCRLGGGWRGRGADGGAGRRGGVGVGGRARQSAASTWAETGGWGRGG